MSRRCAVCQSPHKAAIDEALVSRQRTYRDIARQFAPAFSKDAIARHAARHLPQTLAKSESAREIVRADSLMDQVRLLHEKTLGILNGAEAADDKATFLRAVRESRENLALLARLLGQLGGAQVQVAIAAQAPADVREAAYAWFGRVIEEWATPEERAAALNFLGRVRREYLERETRLLAAAADAREPAHRFAANVPSLNGEADVRLLPGGGQLVGRVDDAARGEIVRRAQAVNWPHLRLTSGRQVAGEVGWRTFALAGTQADIAEAMKALSVGARGPQDASGPKSAGT